MCHTNSDRMDALQSLAPLAREWFASRFGAPTEAQTRAWPAIASRTNALLVAPTGSGKTLAAFLEPLGRLATEAWEQPKDPKHPDAVSTPGAGIRVLYISPLRALDADIHHNLRAPLEGISSLARKHGREIFIDHAVRTGDTPARQRREAAKRPPHILITTPESLFVLLGAAEHRRALARVELVIVDELHAVADSKRGTHLALSLERLELLCAKPPQRVGLTATAEPLDRLAELLVGDRSKRGVELLDARRARSLELRVDVVPARDAGEGKRSDQRVERVADLVHRAQRSLVFVGSRMLAERFRPSLQEALAKRSPNDHTVGIHHGALAREVREQVEGGFRDGTLRAVVATSSLELGIDIGAVDQVVQVGAPGGIARLLQRVGRAGHSPGATARGVLVSLGGVDLLECALTARLALDGRLEPVRIPDGPLDVLAQQLVAYVAACGDDGTTIDDCFVWIRRSYPYRSFQRDALVRLIDALASSNLRAPRLLFDRATGKLHAPDSAKKLAQLAGGAIASRGLYRMLDADRREQIGELDEEFVHESSPGDRFNFGLGVYRIVSIRPDAVLVRPAPPGSARMPFWRGDRPLRASATGKALGASVRTLEPYLGTTTKELARRAQEALPLTAMAAEALASLLETQALATPLPTDQVLVVESYQDALGEPRIALHSWLGRSVLEPWSVALAARMEARFGGVVHSIATDNGVLLAPPKGPSIDYKLLPSFVSSKEVLGLLEALLPRTSVVGAAFREAAERSLLLPKMPFKKRTPLWMNRQRARDLLLSIGDDPSHPLLREALREVLFDRWEIRALEEFLAQLENGTIRTEVRERKTPSPFARGLETAFKAEHLYDDDAPAGERLARAAYAAGRSEEFGTFDAPLELVGIASRADRGLLTGLSPELPIVLLVARARGPVDLEELAKHLQCDLTKLRTLLEPHIAAGELSIGRFTERVAGDLSLEVCDAEELAKLRRKALSRARRAVEPVPRRAYQRWLLERQGVGPYAKEGEEAISDAMERLAMFPIPPETLERDLLRVRTRRYEPAMLDLACARGEVRYVLLESPARIILANTSSVESFPGATKKIPGPLAEKIREQLRSRGALFFGDLALSVGSPAGDVATVLSQMLSCGELTNDAFAPARSLLFGVTRKATAGRYALRPSVSATASMDALVERLLRRYGVVARPFVELEELAPAWGSMREELDRREQRGEVRRGEVVEGLGPVQYARTEVIEALRAARSDLAHEMVLLSSRDPSLIAEVGGLGRTAGTRVFVRDGEVLGVSERDGAVLRTLRTLTEREAVAIVEGLRSLARIPATLRPFRYLAVESIDEGAATTHSLAEVFVAQGFERDGSRFVLPSFRA